MKPERRKTVAKGSASPRKEAPAARPKPKPAKAKPAKTPAIPPMTRIEIPAFLLEGDASPAPPFTGPGQRYALRAAPAEARLAGPETGDLPEAYGTRRLVLIARDPHWLYAHWDLTRDQLKRYAKLSMDGHLVLRVYRDVLGAKPFNETHVHPESRNWFVHVGVGGAKFFAELGYYQSRRKWVSVSTSKATLTPPDTMSNDLSISFETLPPELRFEQLLQLVKAALREQVPLLEAIQQLRATGHPGLPQPEAMHAQHWTPEQEQALAEMISMDSVRRVWMGSLEITEVIRRQYLRELSSMAAAQLGRAGLWSSAGLGSISSPFGLEEKRKGFWFNVNAELIIYGATEPDAAVTLGGRVIRLRPDGTFSYRFALPDGSYPLPAAATSADGTDQRTAALFFTRSTEYQGDVGQHPQDPGLSPPNPEHLA